MAVFADTHYWITTVASRDPWLPYFEALSQRLRAEQIVTTEEVLVEFLNFVSGYGPHVRQLATRAVRRALEEPQVTVLEQSHESFLRGLDLYERSADKGYSLVDCISMEVMRQRGISEVLSGDQHFRQEGFVPLIDPGTA